jgi:hypothetical protein
MGAGFSLRVYETPYSAALGWTMEADPAR